MALIKSADRVLHATTTAGTGVYQLGPVPNGFVAYLDEPGIASGDKVQYTVVDDLAGPVNFEVGIGTLTAGTPATLSRDTIYRSSNGNAAVNWPAGTRYLFASAAARSLLVKDTAGNFDFGGAKATGLAAPTAATDAVRYGDFSYASGWYRFPRSLVIQFGSTVATPNANGDITINLFTAFVNNGYITTVCNGDTNLYDNPIISVFGPLQTVNSFAVRCRSASNAPITTGMRINWTAIGSAP